MDYDHKAAGMTDRFIADIVCYSPPISTLSGRGRRILRFAVDVYIERGLGSRPV